MCIWRNPERTMTRIFPDANDYKTINYPIKAEERSIIEKKLGVELLPGQRERYQYFILTRDDGTEIGYIMAASQKGEFGAVEFVFVLNTDQKINAIYIQRSRERENDFKTKEFLQSFKGKSLAEIKDLKLWQDSNLSFGKKAVLKGIYKELLCFQVAHKNK